MAVGGSFIEITYNHPTLGSGSFFPMTDEAGTYDLGGFRTADESKSIDGAGRRIKTMTNNAWMFEVVVSNDNNDTKDLEKAAALGAHPQDASWTFAHINGTVYAGEGSPVGDLSGDGKAATFTLKVSGSGKLRQL